MVSCQISELDLQPEVAGQPGNLVEEREVVITASADGSDAQTRTSRGSDGKIYWSAGDAIKIFSAGESAKFVSQNTVPSTMAQFRGTISFVAGAGEDGTVSYAWGLYPYTEDAYYDAEQDAIVTTLPSYQKSKAKTFDDNMAIAIGKSSSMDFSFKNAYSGVRVRFYRDDIVSVTLQTRNREIIAGKVAIGLDPLPVIKSVTSPARSITMVPTEGRFLPSTATEDNDYYIMTLPDVDLANGFYLTLRRADGYMATYTHSTNKLERNRFKNLTEAIDTRIEKEENIQSGISTDWFIGYNEEPAPNEIWYETDDYGAVTYAAKPYIGNEVTEIIAPRNNQGTGIIRFKAPLRETDPYAFGENGNSHLTSVTLPESVETINGYTFSHCNNLTSVSLGKNVKTINACAFFDCGIRSMNLPEGLETIVSSAFTNCPNLESVNIPQSVTSIGADGGMSIPANPFRICKALTTFSGKYATPDGKALIVDDYLLSFATGGMDNAGYAVPSNVKHIGFEAFEDATIGSIILPEGLKTIYDYAFNYCTNLTSVTIPSTVDDIYHCAFWSCYSLQSITILRNDKVMQAKTSDPNTTTDGLGVFSTSNGCPIFVPENALNWYKYGQYWDYYGSNLGDDCRYQTSQPLNEIWYTVVAGTSYANAVGVTDWSSWNTQFNTWIETYYDSSKNMYVAKFQETINWIPDEAFRGNEALKSVYLPPVPSTSFSSEIGEYAFEGCINLEYVQFGGSYEGIYEYAFANCNLKSVVVPNTNNLEAHAFSFNHNLTSVALSEFIDDWPSVVSSNPFTDCESILGFTGNNDMVADGGKCLILGDKLVSYATASTTGTYTVPSNVKQIGSHAMYHSSFGHVILPDGLTEIGWGAFAECQNLKDLDIPESVTEISGIFISGSPRINYVKMNSLTPPDILDNSFDGVPDRLVVKIPGAGYNGYKNHIDYPLWYALRDRFLVYQTDREVWYHYVDNNNSALLKTQYFNLNVIRHGTMSLRKDQLSPVIPFPETIDPGEGNYLIIASAVFDGDVTAIPDAAFSYNPYNQSKLDWCSLPATVTEIGKRTFMGCSKLILAPFVDNSIVTIGDDAFNGCSSMLLDLDDSSISPSALWSYFRLTSIGARAFKGCTSINWPVMCTNKMTIGDSAFEGSSLRGFVFRNVSDLGKSAFKNCNELHIYPHGCQIGGLMTEIKDSTFYGCSTLEKLMITEESPIKALGGHSFSGCTSLETIGSVDGVAQLPGVERLTGNNIFYNTNIKVLKLPDLKNIYGTAEFSYSPITQLEMPSLETAYSNAFVSMNSLEELNLPSIKSLGTDLFTPGVLLKLHLGPDLSSLNNRLWAYGTNTFEVELYLDSVTPPSVSENTFDTRRSGGSQIMSIRAVYVPSGSVNAYKQSTAWAEALAVAGATTDVIQAMPTD